MSKISIGFQTATPKAGQVAEQVMQLFRECGYEFLSEDIKKIELVLVPTLMQEFSYKENEHPQLLAKNQAALFYGAIQLVLCTLFKERQQVQLPQIKERCLMIDIGRKFYSLKELKRLVRSMALFNFTHLQLHFSENEGFRIESKKHPEIVSEQYLTQKEVQELIAYCQNFYIEVIPDIDSPGHLEQVLKAYPDWQLKKIVEGKTVADVRALDILNQAAVDFVFEIYQEYAVLFKDSRYFHIGADEFIDFDQVEIYPTLQKAALEKFGEAASGIEIFTEYVNNLVAKISALGFTVRVWNDGFYRLNRKEQLLLTKNCEISYWTRWNKNMAPVETFFEAGYQVVNHNDNYFYYVLGEMAGYSYPTYEKIQEGFVLNLFANNQLVSQRYLKQTPAVALAIWADKPDAQTSGEVIDNVFYLQAALNEKVTGKNRNKTYYVKLFEHWKK
ncbi:hypothetical protein EsVE80_01780 [Enterococcus saigonensis]|uniref:Glycoside hydrolase family 20 catalytic domain-containing protein n=1 Tax=Enterococcus saigonensis TaxID=1805431 RepID=A0A679IHE4_9ENTE|nr:family 20 glycosylhydrolase [Enterococcus saigonensis]BCA84655.1 hypothetical protein EsVE80_01780 [Enterococcus saigonensis]